jgi:uncharacterized tellurite resistance protein B-like protein
VSIYTSIIKKHNETSQLNNGSLSTNRQVFYSIAAVDKTVRPEEIKELKKIIQKEWLPLENTHFIWMILLPNRDCI